MLFRSSRATVIGIDSKRPVFTTVADVLERKDVRVILVRGFDYGQQYQDMVETLQKQNRLVLETDPLGVARVLKSNPNDITIIAPVVFFGAIQNDPRVSDMLDKIRIEPLAELPWNDNGLYISKTSLSKEDAATLLALLNRPTVATAVWKSFQNYYPAAVLKESIRPRDAK